MTQKELIRQEIERRIENYWSDGDVDSVVVSGELEELIDFIDSLPECEETAKIPTEKYEEELNEEIQGFIDEYGYERGEDKILIAIVARHFAEWQKEQMMKDAVDYKICNNLAAYPVIYYEVNHLGLKYGDKVKLIIVKQDDRPRD